MPQVHVSDNDELYRRIFPDHFKNGVVSLSAFRVGGKPDHQMSVDLVRLTTLAAFQARGKNPDYKYGVGILLAGFPRQPDLGFDVVHAPEEANAAHALIIGQNTLAKCKQLADELSKHIVVSAQPRDGA